MRKILVYLFQKAGLYHWAVRLDTRRRNARLKKAFDRYGLEALCQADKAFRSVGSFVFPTFGTLLGAYREKGFIPHDNDLDVGYLDGQKPENMEDLLAGFGFVHDKQFYLGDSGRIIEDTYSYKGVQVDFFTYFTEGEDMYCYITRRHETKDWRSANTSDGFPTDISRVAASGFSEQPFLGTRLYMPDRTRQWLEDIFSSSFMTPVKDFVARDFKTRISHNDGRAYRRYFK